MARRPQPESRPYLPSGGYVTAELFADMAGMSDRAARKALARAASGKRWNGTELTVRAVSTRGGAGGMRYEVAVASLPEELQRRAAPPCNAPEARMPARRAMGADWRLSLVRPVCEAGPAGSEARAAKLKVVAASAVYPGGKRAGQPVAERTMRAWIAAYDKAGALPLLRRKPRADRGASRVIAWREWDRAMEAAGVPEARQRDIAAELVAKVRGLWAGGASSAANIQFLMVHHCRALAEGAGLDLPEAEMAALCRMPLHFAGQKDRRRARMAHIKRNDAARWAARHVPRIRRHRDGLRPMDLVAVDVRHSDILYRRPDGSLATPKVIAFLDLATNRLFARPFLLPKGEMIRREHVLVALRDLASDPAWGVWRGLYLDNGGEFELGAAPEDLAHLADLVRRVHDDAAAEGCGNIKSRPYNPQSKIIESIFSAFTRSIEPMFPGFIGGNRMAKKTQNQGRAPVPMPGDEPAILARFAEMVAFYNAKPQQRGHIKGRSPNDAFAAFVADAAQPWRAIVLDPREFALAFGPDETRTVQPGGELHVRGRVLAHPDLAARVGEKVRVRLPILAPSRAVVLTDKGEPVLVAAEAEATGLRDKAGVRSHDGGRRRAAAGAARAAEGAARMNPAAEMKTAIAALPAPATLAPVANVAVHPVLREAAEGSAVEPLRSRRDVQRREAADAQEAALRIAAEAFRRAG